MFYYLPFVLGMDVSSMFEQELYKCYTVVSSSEMKWCRVATINVSAIHGMWV
jgi:hypothetical protein